MAQGRGRGQTLPAWMTQGGNDAALDSMLASASQAAAQALWLISVVLSPFFMPFIWLPDASAHVPGRAGFQPSSLMSVTWGLASAACAHLAREAN